MRTFPQKNVCIKLWRVFTLGFGEGRAHSLAGAEGQEVSDNVVSMIVFLLMSRWNCGNYLRSWSDWQGHVVKIESFLNKQQCHFDVEGSPK